MKVCSDEALATICSDEGRVLVTFDVDFADLTNYPPGEHAGIIVLRLQRQDVANTLDVLSKLLEMLESESVENKLWIASEERVRIRG